MAICALLYYWLRGLKSNLRYASNWLYGEIVSTLEIEYSDPSLNLYRSQYLKNLSQHLLGKFSKNKITGERFQSSTNFGMAS